MLFFSWWQEHFESRVEGQQYKFLNKSTFGSEFVNFYNKINLDFSYN